MLEEGKADGSGALEKAEVRIGCVRDAPDIDRSML